MVPSKEYRAARQHDEETATSATNHSELHHHYHSVLDHDSAVRLVALVVLLADVVATVLDTTVWIAAPAPWHDRGSFPRIPARWKSKMPPRKDRVSEWPVLIAVVLRESECCKIVRPRRTVGWRESNRLVVARPNPM